MTRYTENNRAAHAELRRLIAEYGVEARYGVNARLSSSIGRTMFHTVPLVEMGRWALEDLTEFEVVDTVRHEYAHVLCGPGEGHGPKWQAKARMLGTTPEPGTKVSYSRPRPGPKWILRCPTCSDNVGTRHRRVEGQNFRHNRCGTRVLWVDTR